MLVCTYALANLDDVDKSAGGRSQHSVAGETALVEHVVDSDTILAHRNGTTATDLSGFLEVTPLKSAAGVARMFAVETMQQRFSHPCFLK
ncbi:hypothetical protein FB468_1395 [Leucobacter komagatae]|uniref:Uncharacterized protein n=1 Tax=Leucobacter komagatae TaxID=55969 RepID=A0A542Y5L4_9MICO|nr:hypothetical protein [Leucobacter komagatae]TQL43374.1 hypothetical protein FB468_1395 [Leucobacter komagatae]